MSNFLLNWNHPGVKAIHMTEISSHKVRKQENNDISI